MAWTNSKVMACFIQGVMTRSTAYDVDTDTITCALYNNTTTPDNTVAVATGSYNTGVWATANEVYQAGQWAQAGVNLASVTATTSTTTFTFDAADTASGSAATLASVYGGLVYDNTITTPTADSGMSFNYFGGSNSVTAGTLTVVWNASGIFTVSTA